MAQPLLVHDDAPEFAAAVLAGLAQPQKIIPARFFYDRAGSELFEAITDLPEYYPTRTEIGILTGNAGAIAEAVGPGRAVIEFGSGSSVKTPLLLRAGRRRLLLLVLPLLLRRCAERHVAVVFSG